MDAPHQNTERLWNHRFVSLISIEVLFMFAAYLTNPVVSGLALTLGASIAVGGILAGLPATMALVARPATGWLADRLNKKSFLLLSAVMSAVACFGCAFSPSVALVGAFRVLQGIAFAFKSAVVVSLVTLSVPSQYVGRAVGWTGLCQTVACALGPMLGAVIIGWAGYPASFFCAGLLFVVALGIIGCYREPAAAAGTSAAAAPTGQSKAVHKKFSLRDLIYFPNIPVATMAGLSILPHGVAVTMLMTVGELRGIAGISIYFALYSLAAFVSKPTAGRLTDQRGTQFVLIPALVIEIAATVVLALMTSAATAALAGALMGIGQGSAYAALQADSMRGVASHELGRASNTFYIGTDIGMGFGPMAESVVLERFGVAAMFFVCSLLVALALGMVLVRRKKADHEGED